METTIQSSRTSIYTLTKMAICISLICVASYLFIPLPFTPVVISVQTIVINLVPLILTPKQSFATLAAYLAIGAIGLPVFAGGTGGMGKLLSPTGGFYFGFVLAVTVISLVKGKNNDVRRYIVATVFAGMPIIYLFAVIFMCYFNDMGLKAALLAAVVPFLIGDVIKAVIASFLGVAINKIMKKGLQH